MSDLRNTYHLVIIGPIRRMNECVVLRSDCCEQQLRRTALKAEMLSLSGRHRSLWRGFDSVEPDV